MIWKEVKGHSHHDFIHKLKLQANYLKTQLLWNDFKQILSEDINQLWHYCQPVGVAFKMLSTPYLPPGKSFLRP